MSLMVEKTVPYKTWVKRSLVEALREVFDDHPDVIVGRSNVTVEYPTEEARYPAIIVRFFERDINNAGVGHEEIITLDGNDYRFKHYLYTGDIEFAIHALSSLDRDLISDALVQTLTMGDLTAYTQRFFERIYNAEFDMYPKAEYNYINLNSDHISGFGETQTPAPWQPEDVLVYQTSYRIGIFGEFYSLPPENQDGLGYVEEVDEYPYVKDIESLPTGADDPAVWQPSSPLDE